MEREYQKTDSNDMFDFRKSNTAVEEQLKKVEYAGYRKLAFMSIAVAAFLSIGLTLGNIGVTKYKASLEIDKIHEMAQIQQQQNAADKALQAQEKAKETSTLEAQKEIDFFANKIKSIDKPTFVKFIEYLQGHQNLYDDRVKNLRQALFEAQSANRRTAIDPNSTSKELEVAVVNYKKDLEDVITKTNDIYSAVKDNHIKENKINLNDMKTFLKLYDQFSNGLVIHNKPIELRIKDILYLKNQANVEYNNAHDLFNVDERINQDSEKMIKKFKP